jgi:hypothetical protein
MGAKISSTRVERGYKETNALLNDAEHAQRSFDAVSRNGKPSLADVHVHLSELNLAGWAVTPQVLLPAYFTTIGESDVIGRLKREEAKGTSMAALRVKTADYRLLLRNIFLLGRLLSLFREVDINDDKKVSFLEFLQGARQFGLEISEAQAAEQFMKMDQDQNGEIDYHEFAEYAMGIMNEGFKKSQALHSPAQMLGSKSFYKPTGFATMSAEELMNDAMSKHLKAEMGAPSLGSSVFAKVADSFRKDQMISSLQNAVQSRVKLRSKLEGIRTRAQEGRAERDQMQQALAAEADRIKQHRQLLKQHRAEIGTKTPEEGRMSKHSTTSKGGRKGSPRRRRRAKPAKPSPESVSQVGLNEDGSLRLADNAADANKERGTRRFSFKAPSLEHEELTDSLHDELHRSMEKRKEYKTVQHNYTATDAQMQFQEDMRAGIEARQEKRRDGNKDLQGLTAMDESGTWFAESIVLDGPGGRDLAFAQSICRVGDDIDAYNLERFRDKHEWGDKTQLLRFDNIMGHSREREARMHDDNLAEVLKKTRFARWQVEKAKAVESYRGRSARIAKSLTAKQVQQAQQATRPASSA